MFAREGTKRPFAKSILRIIGNPLNVWSIMAQLSNPWQITRNFLI